MQAQTMNAGALDSLVAAVTAAATGDFPNGQAGATSANLDAIFGTNSFSSAYSNAAVQKPEEAISPLWARMLLNHFVQSLSSTLVGASPNAESSSMPAQMHDMVQTTRSGRVSRPPVVNTRLLEDLQNGGMASVIDALRTTGVPVPPTPPTGQGGDTWSTRPEVARKSAKLASAVPKHLAGWANRPAPSLGLGNSSFPAHDAHGNTALDYSHSSPRLSSSRARLISGKYFQSVQERDAANADAEAGPKRAGSYDSEDEEEPLRKLAREDEDGERRMRAGKPVMSKEEALEKRRERNKKSGKSLRRVLSAWSLLRNCHGAYAAAMLSRQKKKMKLGDLEERLGQSEGCIRELEEHCEVMEDEWVVEPTPLTRRVERLQGILRSHGIDPTTGTSVASTSLPISPALPSPAQFIPPTPHLPTDPLMASAPSASIPGLANLSVPTVDSSIFDSSPFDPNAFDINAFFSFNDDEDDGEFIPRSSPKRNSDSEGESDRDDSPKNRKKRKRKPRRHPHEEEQEDEDEEEFVDEEEEDEDLFLPIEDVPYPPEAVAENVHDLTGDMMKALKVDTRQQLAAVMQKLVDSAGEGGVTEDIVERLKSVIDLAKVQ